MKKMFINSIIILLSSLTIINSFPCPSECICKPTDMDDVDFTRMSYLINCSNIFLNNQQLIYEAEKWSINEDKTTDYDDYDSKDDYIISIDLSNSLSLKKFTNKTIQLTKFSYSIQSLSLSNQEKNFILNSNSFYSSIYENLKILNLSSCCKQIPNQCQEIFRPLKNLQVLDLSGSDMYKTCLNTPDTISSKLRDLILRNNIYDTNTFSHSSRLFDGVQTISGTLDLQNSRFQLNPKLNGNCLFDLFQQIITLDLSSIQFESISNNITIGLTHLLKCKIQPNDILHGTQLVNLYLRQLKLEYLPEWFTHDRFPILNHLDLSNNNFYHIALSNFSNLHYISLAYNPIELNKIVWRSQTIYKSINLRSTIRNQTFNLSQRLKNLFKLTKNIDYSDNEGKFPMNITNIPLDSDFDEMESSLNISRTNLYLFQIDLYDIRRLDISFNHLNELNLGKQMKLNYIDCSNQYLKKLILNKYLLQLNELKCSNNSLKTIENFSLLKNEQLKLIDLSNNLIDSLENLFQNLASRYLHTINLKFNLIEIIPSYIFHRKLISLYDINLSWNKIHTIQNYAFQSPNLQILDLTGNPLKIIESNAILTVSLRLFYIFNDTQQLTDRCIEKKSNDNLLYMYINWFKQNGTLMPKNNQVELDKCLIHYIDSTKSKSMIKQTKNFLTHYILYEIIGIILIGIFFGGIYYYRRNPSALFARFQHYKKLDRDRSIQNPDGISEQLREEDEIVMNLEEPPFRTSNQGPTNV